ncbi:MurR/RpiR family transcriptional regulator, partial [Rhodococcus erythropolis]|nr:MurR/RpiR family transcriptional regulator [Rhodococcus erythropolis]
MTLDRSAPASVDLLARIRASLSSLSPAELRIAEIIEADPSLASTLTVNDLAERASTSTATVVRTAKRLG